MILSISTLKRVMFLFSFFTLLISSTSYAQVTGFDPNNLANIRVDELTDDQVLAIIKQGESSGFTIEQAQAMAIKRGLPASEAQKLKDRINKIQTGAGKPTIDQTGSVESQIATYSDKEVEKANALTGKILNSNPNEKDNKTDIEEKKAVKIYGQQFFRNADIKIFDKSTDAKAPSNYIIGIGDEFGVSVYGTSYYSEVLKVDSKGAINPIQMGPIYVKGLTFDRAKSLIRSKMNQYFDLSNNKIDITLSYSRSITVNIVGEVLKPGSYKIPAINTAFNALIIAGGPNDIGSMREIQIRRNGKTVRKLDVYSYLLNSNSTQDYYLEENDYIVVTSSKKLVKISGEVKRPSTYELLDSEDLFDLIDFSGGLNAKAYKEKIQIVRTLPKELMIIDVNLDSLMKINKEFKLTNGDSVVIRSTIEDRVNTVVINGSVNFPGQYNFFKGMRVSDLIKIAGDLKFGSDLESAYIKRTKLDQNKEYIHLNLSNIIKDVNSPDNILLDKLDEINIYSNKDFTDSFTVNIYGAVKNSKKIFFVEGMTLGDAIRQAGGFNVDAENLRIEISRLNYFSADYTDGQDIKIIVDRIQISNDFNLADEKANYKLQPFDEIFIRSVPNFEAQKLVELRGEVKYPGFYPILSKDEKLANIIKRAGGLNKFAFPEAATFYRPELPGGFIVLKLNDALKKNKSKYNFSVQGGDVITIPTVNDFVGIRGSSIEYLSVLNKDQVNAPYVNGRRANYYINHFGNGFSKESWRRKTYVIQPNSKINRTQNYIIFKIYPKVTKGSTIYVVNKVKKEKQVKKESEPFNWNKFIENTSVKITGLATLLILIRQL